MRNLALLFIVFGLIFTTVSCSKAEEVTVSKYFQAMKHNDKDTMASMAVEPKYLEYNAFKIESVSEPVVEEFPLPAMIQKMEDMKKERMTLAREAGEKRDDVEDLKDQLEETRRGTRRNQIQKDIENAEIAFYQAEQDFKNLVKEMGTLKREIEAQKNLVNLSTGIKSDPETYSGDVLKSIVKVNVTLTNDTQNDYMFTLVKYSFLVNERTLPSRLIILKIQSAEEFQEASQAKKEEAETPAEEVTEEAPTEAEDEG